MKFEVYFLSSDSIKEVLKELFKCIIDSEYKFIKLDELPEEYFNSRRRQYRGDYLNIWLGGLRTYGDIVIAILDVDAYVPPLNFIFGVATPYLKTASVYLPRLKYDADADTFKNRLMKEVLHELGHVWGLSHCSNRNCVMSFSNSIYEVDMKSMKYCSIHFNKLLNIGINLCEDFRL